VRARMPRNLIENRERSFSPIAALLRYPGRIRASTEQSYRSAQRGVR
jgi:hypothetical protein